MRGKLIVIDGVDGTGKNTQSTKLLSNILNSYPEMKYGKDITMISFPRYNTPGCTMVSKYLNGELVNDPSKIDAYTATMFYLIDQSISNLTDAWKNVYNNGGIVICDRYFTSNIIHQGSKLIDNKSNREFIEYLYWLKDNAYYKLGLPKPDLSIWLMADKKSNEKLLQNRANNDVTHTTDIHEANTEYLDKCRETLLFYKDIVTEYEDCGNMDVFVNVMKESGEMKSIDSIADSIYSFAKGIIHPEYLISNKPQEEIENFIKEFSSFNGTTECFTNGNCYWFAHILSERFNSTIYYNHVEGHFATKIDDKLYDITGEILFDDNWKCWDTWEVDENNKSSSVKKRIIADCINKRAD